MAEKTELFKKHLQTIIQDNMGGKVGKETAWNLFKDIMEGTALFTANHGKLSLAGVGRFEVKKAKPKGKKADEGWEFSPRLRYYPSSVYVQKVNTFHGHGDEPFRDLGIFKKEE